MAKLLENGLWPPDIELIREQLVDLLARRKDAGRPLSLDKIAASVGRKGGALVSEFLNHKERGDVEDLAERLKAFLDKEHEQETDKLPEIPFCETQQARMIIEGVRYADHFDQFTMIIAPSGVGKTTTINQLKQQDLTLIVVRVNPMMGANGFMRQLCKAISEKHTGTGQALYERAVKRLTGTGRCIVIDNAHFLPVKALHTLHTLQEEARIGIVLCGIPKMKTWLDQQDDELEQIASRVDGQTWTVPTFGEDDVATLLKAVFKDQDKIDEVLEFLREDPARLTSARRLTNALKKAIKLAEKKKTVPNIEIIKRAFKRAA